MLGGGGGLGSSPPSLPLFGRVFSSRLCISVQTTASRRAPLSRRGSNQTWGKTVETLSGRRVSVDFLRALYGSGGCRFDIEHF